MKQVLVSKNSVHSAALIPYTITRAVFNALSPLDQIAALALEKCGKVVIVENNDEDFGGRYH